MENTNYKRIYSAGTHCVMVNSVTYSESLNNMSQIMAPEGYEVIAVNLNPSQISCNLVVYRNKEDVMVDIYRQDDGKEVSPTFGKPLRKRNNQQETVIEDIKIR